MSVISEAEREGRNERHAGEDEFTEIAGPITAYHTMHCDTNDYYMSL